MSDKKRVKIWVLVYKTGFTTCCNSEPNFSDKTKKDFFACIEIDREVEEGEGLNPNVRSDAADTRRAKQ